MFIDNINKIKKELSVYNNLTFENLIENKLIMTLKDYNSKLEKNLEYLQKIDPIKILNIIKYQNKQLTKRKK